MSEAQPETETVGSSEVNVSGSASVTTPVQDEGLVEREFFNQHDGTKGRLEGNYLDKQENHDAETLRAKLEDRDPDYDNTPAAAGTPLVVKSQLIDNSVTSNPSMASVDSEVVPHATLDVDTDTAPADIDTSHADQVADETEAGGDNPPPGHPDSTVANNDQAAQALAEFQASQAGNDTGGVAPEGHVDSTDPAVNTGPTA